MLLHAGTLVSAHGRMLSSHHNQGGTTCPGRVSHRGALHSMTVKHGCHRRPALLPEENLGEKISWSRRIIPLLLPPYFHSFPPAFLQPQWHNTPWSSEHRKASCWEPLVPSEWRPSRSPGRDPGAAPPGRLSGERGAACPRPPRRHWPVRVSITTSDVYWNPTHSDKFRNHLYSCPGYMWETLPFSSYD